MNNLNQYFNICVTILEARNLAWPNMASVVCIQVGDNTKYTKIHKQSDRPFYNEYFVFDYYITLSELLNEKIILTVYKPRGKINCRSRLGSARLDVGTVWLQEGHELGNKWIALTNPSDVLGQVQGFLKCDICVKSKIDEPLIRPVHVQDLDSNIEGNLFVPENILLGRQKARYSVCIYRGYALGKKTIKNRKKTEKDKELQDVYVEITFASLSCRTTKRKLTRSPEWNEQLTFTEAYPPLYQRLRINVCSGKTIIATRYINFTDISSDTNDEFPPTFGPSFLHLYAIDNTYRGSLLISIETTMVLALKHGELMQGVVRETVTPLKETLYWRMREFLCFAVLYDVSMLDKKSTMKKHLSVSFCFGSNENKVISKEHKAEQGSCEYDWLPIGGMKPCLFLRTFQPDTRNRMFLSNMLLTIAQSLETEIKVVKRLALDGFMSEANKLLDNALNNLINDCKKESFNYPIGMTKLDRGRAKILSRKMDDMISYVSEQIVFEDKILAANTSINKILQLVTDPQDSMPSVQFSLWSEDKLIGNCNVLAQDMIYSVNKKRRGIHSAKLSTHEFKFPNNSSLAGLVDLYLWLGTWEEVSRCLHNLPKGHQDLSQETELPPYLFYSQFQEFVCCCHIYQGQLEPGWTSDDIYNSFVKVFIHNNCVQTEVKSLTLNPLWEEMLFLPIQVYPNLEYVLRNPPNIVVEAWHQGTKVPLSLGRIIVQPYVNMHYTDNDHKEGFKWFDIGKEATVSARILARFEMVEKSAFMEVKLDDEITDDMLKRGGSISIPKFVSPCTYWYRLEIQFWGIREKQHNFFHNPLHKAQVILSCGQLCITSKEMSKDTKFLNFNDPLYIVNLELPELKEYSPPLIIRVMDARSFGLLTYIGTHVVRHIHKFSLKLPTIKEWDRLTSHRKTLLLKLADLNSLEKDIQQENELSQDQLVPLWKEEDGVNSGRESNRYSSKKERLDFLKKSVYFKWLFYLHSLIVKLWKKICNFLRNKYGLIGNRSSSIIFNDNIKKIIEEDKYDWWTKYMRGKKKQESSESGTHLQTVKKWINKKRKVETTMTEYDESDQAILVIYYNELEAQAEFDGFVDVLNTFKIIRGKPKLDDHSSVKNVFAKLKLGICLYRWPTIEECVTPTGLDPVNGVLSNMASNIPRQILVRVYAVKGHNLHPADPNNKADPYIELATHSNVVSDSNNYISKQLNPVFGRCLEVIVKFPEDSLLTVRVKDWDRFTSHDVIGETVIDLENRFYSSHRGSCGLPIKYNLTGCNQWRDLEQPSDILERICQENNIPPPDYFHSSIVIGNKEFNLKQKDKYDESIIRQRLALLALNNWNQIPIVGKHLVPEHVETRSLFLKDKPGIEQVEQIQLLLNKLRQSSTIFYQLFAKQKKSKSTRDLYNLIQGKLEMWVDMFDLSMGVPPPPVNIKVREPEKFELRVVILNTAKVLLVDDAIFIGEKHSDIYVKGWLTDPEEFQNTDVHYMSLNGEGYFNWRFIFPFSYIIPEERMVVYKKNAFEITGSEYKMPARLNLQVWDSDRFSPDDFIGSLSMELCRVPRGAHSWKLCKIDKKTGSAFTIDLFKVKYAHGWWPFLTKHTESSKIAGYVEAELSLLTEEEALKSPAGLGRSDPNPLPKPDRPEYKFRIWMAPFHLLNNMCKSHKKKAFVCLLIFAVGLFMFVAVYSVPMFVIKRIIGAK